MNRLITDKRRIQVVRNPWHIVASKRYEQAWLITCEFCPDDGASLWPFDLFKQRGRRVLGWTATWDTAMQYARIHAANHEASRCPTCECIPELLLTVEALQ